MKIIIVNYRYFVSGGPETYMFNVIAALEELGHEVIPYSIRYKKNRPSEFSKYYAEPISSEESIYFVDHDNSFRTQLKTIKRSIYDKGVEKSIRKCIQETKPDVALVLHYKRKLSPAVLVGLRKEKIPVIVRFSDFLAVCPQSLLLRNGKPCMECIEKKSLLPSLKHRCVKNSLGASLVHYISEKYHSVMKYNDIPACYIVPSKFTKTQLVKAGYPEDKLFVLSTFAPDNLFRVKRDIELKEPYNILYAGNLETYKGIHVAIQAFKKVYERFPDKCRLIVAGRGTETETVMEYIKANSLEEQIELKGFLNKNELHDLFKEIYISIVPSIWYENLPNSLIESVTCGIPVIGSDHGSIAEHIKNGETGYLVEPNNVNALADAIISALSEPKKNIEIGKNAYEYSARTFSQKLHMEQLVELLLKSMIPK